MTVGEHIALADKWEARQRRMTPLAILAVVFLILGAAVWWPWFLGTVLAAPYGYAWVRRGRELAEINSIFSA